ANAMIPFLNARIEGTDRILRTAKDDPGGAAVRAMTAAVVPAVVLLTWNRENPHYADIPACEKEYYWILMKDKTGPQYWKVAKGFMPQPIVNPIQLWFEGMIGTVGEESALKIAGSVLRELSPIQVQAGWMPPLMKLGVEQAAGKGGHS